MVETRSTGRAKANGYQTLNGNGKEARKRTSAEDLSNGEAKRPRLQEMTDRTRWRMRDENGRHTWHYLEDDEAVKKWPQSVADKYYLGLDTVCKTNF